MFGLFKSKPLLDEGTTQWLYDAFAWALANFDQDLFYHQTRLVAPIDEHFPDRSDNPQELAQKILARMQSYAHMQNWPLQLAQLPPEGVQITTPRFEVIGKARGESARIKLHDDATHLSVFFDAAKTQSPDVLIVNLAQGLGYYLAQSAGSKPPGGDEYSAHAADLLAIFMGFGLFYANNAFSVCKGSCGGCGSSVQAFGMLTEDESTYAYALFCTLKDIPAKDAERHLKSTVRPFFKMALKEIKSNTEELARLQAI
ncbi:MAG: hypothetical protein AB1810_06735 [Pseudomonadota bacterium]